MRGVGSERAGSGAPEAPAAGVAELRRMSALNEIPIAVVDRDPSDCEPWALAVRHAIDRLLGVR